MTTTVEAVYEDGTLRLPGPLPLPDKTLVIVTICISDSGYDAERASGLTRSEQSLMNTWDNPADDVFNELLQK
jgi:hypothetical protein